MRAPIAEDPNNVDRIGSSSNPGLCANSLTRAQHRDRLAGRYRGGPKALGTPSDLEELLDKIYGEEPFTPKWTERVSNEQEPTPSDDARPV